MKRLIAVLITFIALGTSGNTVGTVLLSTGQYSGFLDGQPTDGNGIAMTMGYRDVPNTKIGANSSNPLALSVIDVEVFRDSTTELSGVFDNFTALFTNSLNEDMEFTTGFAPSYTGYTEVSFETVRFSPVPQDLVGAVVEKLGFVLTSLTVTPDTIDQQVPWNTNWIVRINVYGTAAAVPEPGTALLIGSNLIGLIALRRRAKIKHN